MPPSRMAAGLHVNGKGLGTWTLLDALALVHCMLQVHQVCLLSNSLPFDFYVFVAESLSCLASIYSPFILMDRTLIGFQAQGIFSDSLAARNGGCNVPSPLPRPLFSSCLWQEMASMVREGSCQRAMERKDRNVEQPRSWGCQC